MTTETERAVSTLARRTLAAGALLGLVGVAAGAFGVHALRGSVTERDLEIWQTGAHYQQLHAVLLVAVGLFARAQEERSSSSRALAAASTLLTLGVLVFSGTLYAMVLGGPRMLGGVTPLGGLCLMGGWAALAVHALSGRRQPPA